MRRHTQRWGEKHREKRERESLGGDRKERYRIQSEREGIPKERAKERRKRARNCARKR